MQGNRWRLGLALAALLGACGTKDKATPASQGEGEGPSKPVRATAALWALAPADAAVGIVIGDGLGGRLFAVKAELDRLIGEQPALAEPYQAMLDRVRAAATFDPFDPDAVRTAGFDPGKGLAVFLDGEGEPLLIALPIGDRKAFAALVGMTTETIQGRVVDRDDDGLACVEAGERYLCAPDLAAIDAALAAGGNPSLDALIGAVPEAARGGFELAADAVRVPGMARALGEVPVLSEPKGVAVGAEVRRGVVTLHARIAATPRASLWKPAPPPPAFTRLDRRSVGFSALSVAPSGVAELLPAPLPPIGGSDLVQLLSGDLAFATRTGELGGALLLVGVTDEAAANALLPQLCAMAAGSGAPVSMKEGACVGVVSLGPELELPLPPELTRMRAAVEGGALAIAMGDAAAIDDLPASPHTAPLMAGAPPLVAWARSFDPLAGASEKLRAQLLAAFGDELDRERALVNGVRWLLAHVAEAGFAVRGSAGAVTIDLIVATFAADPAEVYRSYEQAVAKDLAGDYPGYRDAMAALARAHPETLAGRQARLVEAGAPIVGVGTGVAAAVAIPAFMTYLRRAKASEARQMVRAIYDGARAAREAGAALRSVGPTPAKGACCAADTGPCAPDPTAWDNPRWQALGFRIDAPHYYSYQLEVGKRGAVTVRAFGDLDCDGVFSTYELTGDPADLATAPQLTIDNELE